MLIDNTLFLRERYPEIRKYFLEHEKDLDLSRIKITQSKSDMPTARFTLESGEKELLVHSIYDPIREAERMIKSHADKLTSDTHVFFYGIGLGYHIEKFTELYPELTYSIYEPLPEMFFKMSEKVKLNCFITKKMKRLYIDLHNEKTKQYIEEFKTENRNIHLIVLPSYENIAKEKKESFLKTIKDGVLIRRSELHTNATFQKLWVKNSLINFKEVLNTPNIVRDIDATQFKDKPAIIISAGPSLAEDIEQIRYIKENNLAYIFSVGSAINSLISYGVMPDAVCTYDPSEKNYLVFEKMIEQGIDQIPMIFGSSVGHETLKKYNGPKFHFITSQDRTSIYFLRDQLDLEHDLILDSPSIAVMTFQILNKLGANPIIFAGQNLGYLNDRLYSEGIEYNHINSTVDKGKLEKAPTTLDVYGNTIKTNIAFNNMRDAIESFAKVYKGKTFINTTKGGAAIKNVPFSKIEDVINETLTISINKEIWSKSEKTYDTSHIENQIKTLEISKNNLYNMVDQYTNVLKSISNAVKLRRKDEIQTALIKFDYLYNTMMDNIFYENFLSFYMRVHVEFVGNEIKRLNQETDVMVRGKEIENTLVFLVDKLQTNLRELDNLEGFLDMSEN